VETPDARFAARSSLSLFPRRDRASRVLGLRLTENHEIELEAVRLVLDEERACTSMETIGRRMGGRYGFSCGGATSREELEVLLLAIVRRPGSQPLTPPGEISACPLRSTVMSNLIPAVATILIVMMAFGFPSLAIVIGRYFKMRERELALEMEYRQKSQQQQLAIEERVQHIEHALTRLDHDVRVRLGIDATDTSLPSQADVLEGPAVADAQRGIR
jgi:hypothetical protein